MRHYLDGRSMDDVAIERLRTLEEQAITMHPDGFYVADSFGKDSTVIYDLVHRAGVKADYHHNVTTIDPWQLIRFGRKHHPDTQLSLPEMNMWELMKKKGMPPRRTARYCCEVLKERGGAGRIVVTGIRWGESNRRSKRQMTEACYRNKSKRYFHPIIDWSTSEVWEYIRERELPYCELYDQGFKRLGCILCPMVRDVQRQMEMWPGLCGLWEKAVKATFSPDKTNFFSSPQEYWEWWLDRDAPSLKSSDNVLFEDDPSMEGE